MSREKRLVIGMSGGSGAILGIRFMEVLKEKGWEMYLTFTDTAEKILMHETGYRSQKLVQLAGRIYQPNDLFAPFASGSFVTDGMVVIPCSMKTLAGIANGYAENLVQRAADVCLKERRKLVLVTRETPLNLIHLENMRRVTLAGGIILPPMMTMYTMPRRVEDMVEQFVVKLLQVLGIEEEDSE